MHFKIFLKTLIVLSSLSLVLTSSDFLAEKPAFIESCIRTDPDFRGCFSRNFDAIFREWKGGIPGLKSLGSLDPLHVKSISISQNENNPLIQMNIKMSNVLVSGISKVKTKDISVDFKTLVVKAKIQAPKVSMDSDYNVKGRLLNLPLEAKGKAFVSLDDFNMNLQMTLKLRDEFGHTFTDVDKLELEITDIDGFHIDLQNLFNGQRELEESTNAVINQNWRDFYAVLGPALTNSLQEIMFDRFKKIFGFIPARYLLGDIRTAAEFYG